MITRCLSRSIFTCLLLILLTGWPAQAFTPLLSDTFTATSSIPANWILGTGSISSALPGGDTFAVNSTSNTLVMIDASPYSYSNPVTIHSLPSGNFYATGDKVLQLNAEMTITNSALSYSLGLFDSTAPAYSANANAVILKIAPSSGVITLSTTNGTGSVVTTTTSTTATANLLGSHAYAIQVDYITSGTLTPTVRAYSNGYLLASLVYTAYDGIHPQTSGPSQGSAIRVLAQGFSTSSSGASFALDNISLNSYSPGGNGTDASQINSSRVVNKKIFSHNILGAKMDYEAMYGSGLWTANGIASAVVNKLKTDLVSIPLLRYPGGGDACVFNFKEAIGPVSSRGIPTGQSSHNWYFGLDEFMKSCAMLNAKPMYTAPDILLPPDQMPAHLADLVEYINAPATPAHPWAQKRVTYTGTNSAGYGVQYFELGNESYYGFGNPYLYGFADDPSAYNSYVQSSAWAMRAIDPSIKLGVVTENMGPKYYSNWNISVLKTVGPIADFIITHIYTPYSGSGDISSPYTDPINAEKACMAFGDQLDHLLKDAHTLISNAVGHDLPISVTEFNTGLMNDDTGVPDYRFSYAGAMECADLMRVYLKPENGVDSAQYWQLLNTFYGALQFSFPAGSSPTFTEMPMYHMYRMLSQHTGARLLDATVSSPTVGYVSPDGQLFNTAGNTYTAGTYVSTASFNFVTNRSYVQQQFGSNATVTATGNNLQIAFNNYASTASGVWVHLASAPYPSGMTFADAQVNFNASYTPNAGSATPSSVIVGLCTAPTWSFLDVTYTNPTPFYTQLPGIATASSTIFFLKFNSGTTATTNMSISGVLNISNATVAYYKPSSYPSYSVISSIGSISADNNTYYLILLNKSNYPIPVNVNLSGTGFTATSAKYWEVNGAHLWSTAAGSVTQRVNGATFPLTSSTAASFMLSPHSSTAIEFYR